jgi:hypothetical protein
MHWKKIIRRPLVRLAGILVGRMLVGSEKDSYRFVVRRWPTLRSRIPHEVHYLAECRLRMLVSHPETPLWKWIYSRGGIDFLTSEAPDP